jgi:D-alanyl-D-alanine-carboxypeptidase/D-alanyl-D-alanine-endopeptidase
MRFVRYARFLAFAALGSLLFGAASEVLNLLVNRVDEGKKAVGIVVATLSPELREVTPYGTMAKDRPDTVNGDSVFEIGSITKVFTSVILADMVVHGEVRLDTPVAQLLPSSVNVPRRDGKQITLLDLAMHISGLPRMPPDFKPADMENPFAGFDAPQLYAFLSGYKLPREIGAQYEYSNLGVGLLGHALARKAGMSYGELLRIRILDPLGMNSTSIILSEDQKRRLATGYDASLQPTKNWDFDCLAGAGALRSTANDLLKFLAAALELNTTPITPAMRLMYTVHHATESPDMEIMMGWHVWKRYGTRIIWHNGVTGGYWSFIGFDPVKKAGAVVLSNTRFDNDAIGLHAIDHDWPVEKLDAPREHVEREVDPATLGRYVGVYRFGPTYSIQVSLEYGHLWVRDSSDKALELFPEKDNEFFFQAIDAQVSFVVDAAGKVTRLVLHTNGDDSVAAKVQ